MQYKPTPNLSWLEFAKQVAKPKGVDDALWAELTPKQKVVVAQRLLCVSEYRKEMA
jgi:hypothetical protein